MNEINPAERFILDTLREASPLRKMRDDDWAGLELRVSQVGLARLDGWYGDQVRKAIRQIVEKHPGQHDQSVHGGKKGRSAGSTANEQKPASGGGGGSDSAGDKGKSQAVVDRMRTEHKASRDALDAAPKGDDGFKPKEIVNANSVSSGRLAGAHDINNAKDRKDAEARMKIQLRQRNYTDRNSNPYAHGILEGGNIAFTARFGEPYVNWAPTE